MRPRARQRLGCWWPPARGVGLKATSNPRLGTALHGMESARCWPAPMLGCWGCPDTQRLFLRCSTCSGVPPFGNPLIYKGFTGKAGWNTCRVPACSKVFHVFHLRRSLRDGEQAENPRQPWLAADSGNQISATRQKWLGRSRPDTTTRRHSPPGQWSPWRPVAPATTAKQARLPFASHPGQAAALSAGIKCYASMATHRMPQALPAIRAAYISRWGIAGLDTAQHGKSPALTCRPAVGQPATAMHGMRPRECCTELAGRGAYAKKS